MGLIMVTESAVCSLENGAPARALWTVRTEDASEWTRDPRKMQHRIDTLTCERRDECAEPESSGVQENSEFSSGPLGAVQRRGAPRYRIELDVSLDSGHNFYVGFVENLSAAGVFIATHLLRDVGNTLELCIHLPNSEVVVQALGEVRWVREYSEQSNIPPGMGVRFLRLSATSQRQIDRFLAEREPMVVDEE